jgi:DNA-directed RNA polymerase specialized sigma24 family protein
MRRNWKLTQEAFDGLLAWLSPDREEAGRKYEEIRRTLVKIFISRGSQSAEELADETINRVIDKLPEVAANYVGNKALYFYGIAKKVLLESLKNKSAHPPPPAPDVEPDGDQENRHQCLEKCLARLDHQDRSLVIDYYSGDKRVKIDHRRELAVHRGLSDNALKIKMCRLRAKLYECVRECLKR